jgi:thymidylate synthase
MPSTVNIPPPVEDMDYVEGYFTRYLMSDAVTDNETYTYGSWLAPGVERVIEQLKGAPGNNQAAVSIGGIALDYPAMEVTGHSGKTLLRLENPRDTDNFIDPATGQRDPACLRVVDFRYDQAGYLHMFVYFRSWDLWGGFPANLAGLQLVSEYVAQAIDAKPGRLLAASKGLHLYSHAIQVAAERVGMKDVDSMEDFLNAVEEKDKEGN